MLHAPVVCGSDLNADSPGDRHSRPRERKVAIACRKISWGILVAAIAVALAPSIALAQTASVASVRLRPFVTGFVPVVGNGAVGGISIDSEGVLSRAEIDASRRLRDERIKALRPLGAGIARRSPLRKISLRRLESEIDRRLQAQEPLSEEIELLAGLQRVRHLFVYPEHNDIVLAGPAEGWRVDDSGNLVGITAARPPLQLDDLIVALRTADAAIQTPISCSIDPTNDGLARLQNLLAHKDLSADAETLAAMERSLGPQTITLRGVSPSSRFARTMVAADYMMKRLAMGFEPPPVEGLESYITMLSRTRGRVASDAMPRWWLAPRYDAVRRDADSLAWELSGTGVRAMTEDSLLTTVGFSRSGRKNRLAKEWAEQFSERYAVLADKMPVFAELEGAIDLAIIASIAIREDLWQGPTITLPC